MAKKKDSSAIKDPTIRKITNRGFKPMRYWTAGSHSEIRYGWIIREEPKFTIIRLVGDERNTKVVGKDRKFIKELTPK